MKNLLSKMLLSGALALSMAGVCEATFSPEANAAPGVLPLERVSTEGSSAIGGVVKTVLYIGGGVGVLLAGGILVGGFVYIPDDKSGIVIRKWALNKTLPNGRIIALDGEPGIQADMLMPGVHWGKWPWMYTVQRVEQITISPNQIAVVNAIDGADLRHGQILGREVECDGFQDARKFLEGGGQKGRQLGILTPGKWRINTSVFDVITADSNLEGTGLSPNSLRVVQVREGEFGIVVTNVGTPLGKDDIAACRVEGHNSFQDPQAFIEKGGFRGLQEEGLLPGQFFINPWFATVTIDKQQRIQIGEVGVVTSFINEATVDGNENPTPDSDGDVEVVTTDNGDLAYIVPKGQKGVWNVSLGTGKYPINPETRDVQKVPITNIVLNWDDEREEQHHFDHDLATLHLTTSDGFELGVNVAQVIYIARENAPYVIARMGSMTNLVANLLEPIVSGVFRDIAQKYPALAFVVQREKLRREASEAIHERLAEYRITAIETVIGQVAMPSELLKPIQARQLAEQETATHAEEEKREKARRLLEETRATADIQAEMVRAARNVEIQQFEGQSALRRAEGEAAAAITRDQARARGITMVGEAQAGADKARCEAVGGPEVFALIEAWRRVQEGQIAVVPQISMGGGAQGSPADALIAQLLLQSRVPSNDQSSAPAEEGPNDGAIG
jgi:uncharacterized membrane protein YqiK